MADYYPLIHRAVSGLQPNTLQRREAIYARAREALDRQLLSLEPPIPEADLRRERGALEATIRRVEAEFAPPPPPFKSTVAPARDAVSAVPDPAPPAEPELQADAEARPAEPVRPKVALGGTRSLLAGGKRKLGLAIGLPAVVLIAGAAWLLRDDPSRYQQRQQAAQAEQGASGARKSDGRLDGPGSSAAPATGPRPGAPAPGPAALPVASRVLFFEETPTDPRGVQSEGIMVWRLDTVTTPGQPADRVIRGAFTVAGAKVTGDFVVKRNRNAALPASHTIELIFRPEGEREAIREISPIEARDQETNPGAALQGAMVPVAPNLFLIGLDRSEAGMVRNLEAMREKRWFAFQFRFASGKLGAMLIEKGQTGDRVFREALDSWR